MAHKSEKAFQDKLVEYLALIYGEENIETQKYLSEIDRYQEDARRFCDIWIDGPMVNFAIEVESNFEACFKGISQAELYAKFEDNTVPIVALHRDHIKEPELSMLRENTPIVVFDI